MWLRGLKDGWEEALRAEPARELERFPELELAQGADWSEREFARSDLPDGPASPPHPHGRRLPPLRLTAHPCPAADPAAPASRLRPLLCATAARPAFDRFPT